MHHKRQGFNLINLSLAFLSLMILLAGCRQATPLAQEKTTVFLATGGSNTYYANLGHEMAERVNAQSQSIVIVTQLSAGPEANLRLLSSGSCQLGIVTADLAYYGREGTEMFEDDGPGAEFVLLAQLDMEPLFIVSRVDSSIKDIAGLKGKEVSLGRGGSRTQVLAHRLLDSIGFDISTAALAYLTEEEALRSLEENNLDAAFLLAPFPRGGGIQGENTKIIPLTPEQEELLTESLPFVAAAGVYIDALSGQDEGLFTPAIPVMVAACKDLAREILDELSRALAGAGFHMLSAKNSPAIADAQE